MWEFIKELHFIDRIFTAGNEYYKEAAIAASCVVTDIELKSSQKETSKMFFEYFLEIEIMVALILLNNNKGNNTNLEKSIETCRTISDAIETQLLESFTTVQIKSFNKEEWFNLPNQEIIDIFKEHHFKETPEEFLKLLCNYRLFQDNNINVTKQNSNDTELREVTNFIESTPK